MGQSRLWKGRCTHDLPRKRLAENFHFCIRLTRARSLRSSQQSLTYSKLSPATADIDYYLSHHHLSEALKWNYLVNPLLVFSLAASKISICLLLLRVLYFPYAVIAILTIIAVPSAGYCLGQCQPVSELGILPLPATAKILKST